MRVLVVFATQHNGTAGIAEAIGRTLRQERLDAEVQNVTQVPWLELDPYDAVVVGSAVYAGHWLEGARDFVDRHARALQSRRVWLFSSGPIGDPPVPRDDPVDVAPILQKVHAVGHRLFGGRIDERELGPAERAIVTALRAPTGDFRNFDDIEAWAHQVAAWLQVQGPQRNAS